MKNNKLTKPAIAPSDEQIKQYKFFVYNELVKLNVSEPTLNLVNNSIIIAAILNKQKPEDLAWAIAQ